MPGTTKPTINATLKTFRWDVGRTYTTASVSKIYVQLSGQKPTTRWNMMDFLARIKNKDGSLPRTRKAALSRLNTMYWVVNA